MSSGLGLRSLPLYKCCSHCKDAYCPNREGHYAVCPIRSCTEGQELQRKTENDRQAGWTEPYLDKEKTGKMLISTSIGTEGHPEGSICPVHNEVHGSHGWYRCKEV